MIAIAIATGQNSAGLDPAASAFIQATGITGELQKAAINNLVLNLKKYNLWSKMKAVYPFVTDNRNLFGYTEDFASGWTNTGTTVTSNTTTAPNGTLTADTLADVDGTYARLQQTIVAQSSAYTMSIYVKKTSTIPTSYSGFEVVGKGSYLIFNSTTGGYAESGGTNYTTTVTSVDSSWWRLSITTTAIAGSRVSTIFPAISTDGTTINPTATGAIIAWGAQLELGSTATDYQPIATTQQAFIASQFKFNLKDPRDLDAAYRLVFNGGWTHSSTGATPNGTNGWANTYLNPFSVFSSNDNVHMGYYSRTNVSSATIDMGSAISSAGPYLLLQLNVTGSTYYIMNEIASYTTAVDSDSRGLFIGSRNGTTVKGFKNNANVATRTGIVAQIRPNKNIYLGAGNYNDVPGNYANRQCAFSTIGDGLTDDDATNLYYSTQVFQTTLGRQVGSPAYALPAVNDVNAKLYLSAINSSDPTVNGAVDTFISGLKTDGIYSKMKAVYPFATDNRNSMSYTEDFTNAYWFKQQGGITANTVTAPNGTTTADSFLEDTALTTHGVLKSFTLSSATAHTYSLYVKQLNGREAVTIRFGSSNVDGVNGTYIGSVDFRFATQVISGDLTGSVQILPNGWYRLSVTVTPPTTSLSIALWSNNGSTVNFAGDVTKGFNLWGAQLELGSTATTYQPQLGSAQSYFANQFKYNMINPQDDDSAFRLVFNGGWTHSPQGATPNGTNGYADTKLVPSSVLTLNSNHISYYSRTNANVGTDMGVQSDDVIGRTLYMAARNSLGNLVASITTLDANRIISSNANSTGFYVASRISDTSLKSYKNSLLQATNTTAGISSQANAVLAIGCLAYKPNTLPVTFISYSTKQVAFSTIGDGLTDTEAANLYSRVQNLQTLLNRQV